ncbi:uncharacterized protein vex isoform X2 [Eurosta solidaginis]|uniref:uncharacterized protein vex isoform X2 n=1 Tax=Eurosta solidaginis TaxID=178769 RepID=UPI0035311EB7
MFEKVKLRVKVKLNDYTKFSSLTDKRALCEAKTDTSIFFTFVVDCQVGDWTPWSECDKSCGMGVTSRTRKMMQAPQNGGKHCPSLTQKRNCQGFRCHGEQNKRILHETAFLTPSLMKQTHSPNKTKTSVWHPRNTNRHGSKEHCIEFEVIKVAKECHNLPPYKSLIEGDRIAIRCNFQEKVIKSNLMKKNKPNKNAKTSTGKENVSNIKENKIEGDSFEVSEYGKAGIFTIGLNSVNDKMSMSLMHTAAGINEKKLTVLDRCRGEGVPGRITRWRSLTVPSCRGKWLRLTLGTPKKCTHSQFSFV